MFGGVWREESDGLVEWCAASGPDSVNCFAAKPKARAALKAAAEAWIKKWFEEQAE